MPPFLLARFSLAVVAAVVLHLGVLVAGRPGLPRAHVLHPVTAMTVRSVAAATMVERAPDAVAPVERVLSSLSARQEPGAAGPTVAATTATALPATAPHEAASASVAIAAPVKAEPPAPAPAPAVPAALPPAPDYFLTARLDPGPQPIGEIEPEYPDQANLQEGAVVIRVLISDSGRVDKVDVVRSEPRGLFEEAAMEAFAKAKFTPGRIAGVPVKSQITVEVHFLPINRGSRISGRGY